MKTNEIIAYMESLHNEGQRIQLMKFFKTGVGEYGEGDEFLGLKVPQTREILRNMEDLPLDELPTLLTNRFHEIRLLALLMLVRMFQKLATKRLTIDECAMQQRDEIVDFYVKNADYANNWDLVDLSAPKIMGHWLMLPSRNSTQQALMDELAFSDNLWRQRISMVSTWMTSKMGNPYWCLRYAEIHLQHPHDLMQKAVGWMLREMGKQIDMDLLRDFLKRHLHHIPRTTLRYAIEKMSDDERKKWMMK